MPLFTYVAAYLKSYSRRSNDISSCTNSSKGFYASLSDLFVDTSGFVGDKEAAITARFFAHIYE